jgi:ribosomal protein S18 acetylase RimI-like enzyme
MASTAIAVEANLFAFFDRLASWPRVEYQDDGACCWTLSDLPFPLFNSVVRARFGAADADAGIEARIRACETRAVPMLWWTGPGTTPTDLGERLLRRGFLLEPAFGMTADLSAPVEPRHGAAVEVTEVESEAALTEWSEVLCAAFGAPPAFGTAFSQLTLALGLGPSSSFRHFLARHDGEPVATASVFFGAGVAGIYDVATLPDRRRQGLGTAVTRAALAAARAGGARQAILHASAAGAGVYRSLGFVDVCDIGQYVWLPEKLRHYNSEP